MSSCVQLHARGDHLWALGSGVEASPLNTEPSSRSHKSPAPPTTTDDLSSTLAETTLTPSSSSTSPDLTPQEVDTLLRNALLLSISTVLSKPSNAKLFPLPASSIYSTYILPYRPAGTPPSADIKKSSFKKLAALMKQASKAGVVVTKEVKGELLVMSVNGEHAE